MLLVLAVLYERLVHAATPWSGWIAYPALLFSTACILSKRLHDRGRAGWWAFLIVFALVAVWPVPHGVVDALWMLVLLWGVVDLGLMPGEPGTNRFGPKPAAR